MEFCYPNISATLKTELLTPKISTKIEGDLATHKYERKIIYRDSAE